MEVNPGMVSFFSCDQQPPMGEDYIFSAAMKIDAAVDACFS